MNKRERSRCKSLSPRGIDSLLPRSSCEKLNLSIRRIIISCSYFMLFVYLERINDSIVYHPFCTNASVYKFTLTLRGSTTPYNLFEIFINILLYIVHPQQLETKRSRVDVLKARFREDRSIELCLGITEVTGPNICVA